MPLVDRAGTQLALGTTVSVWQPFYEGTIIDSVRSMCMFKSIIYMPRPVRIFVRPFMCPVSFEIHPCHLFSLSLTTLITLLFIYFLKPQILFFLYSLWFQEFCNSHIWSYPLAVFSFHCKRRIPFHIQPACCTWIWKRLWNFPDLEVERSFFFFFLASVNVVVMCWVTCANISANYI